MAIGLPSRLGITTSRVTSAQVVTTRKLLLETKKARPTRGQSRAMYHRWGFLVLQKRGKEFHTCRRPSRVLCMVTHFVGCVPFVVMAVISASNSSRFSLSFFTRDSIARLLNDSDSPPCLKQGTWISCELVTRQKLDQTSAASCCCVN